MVQPFTLHIRLVQSQAATFRFADQGTCMQRRLSCRHEFNWEGAEEIDVDTAPPLGLSFNAGNTKCCQTPGRAGGILPWLQNQLCDYTAVRWNRTLINLFCFFWKQIG